ncbi:hypothetical protein RSOLAG22IIIB_09984 [Rhizoctonia solani]|uniref:F-box domain-containing protein n=1 Tax=Rhizoctonia solani TaxID=456999 RepID=A0A0K6G0T4_9AGAM|nr:hypothetical protein RSOLAG22IIIB_09984 [Rhizoctonia solani]
MGTRGYFAYRYKKKYYRQYLSHDAYPSYYGQQLANAVPRDPIAFKDWVAAKTKMLENIKPSEEEVIISDEHSDSPGYNLCADLGFTFIREDSDIEWTYVIDLDNLIFTVNAATHLKLDNMPPSEPGLEGYFENKVPIPPQHLGNAQGLWPLPGFDVQERQEAYEALDPIIVPATGWGISTWDTLTFPQRFSIEIVHFLVQNSSGEVALAYSPYIQYMIGGYCWDALCAAIPSIPFAYDNNKRGFTKSLSDGCGHRPYAMCYKIGTDRIKTFQSGGGDNYYCWIRGCLVTFCVWLGDPAYVASEVEQMVRKMEHDGHGECIGIILSSQYEMIAVAVDDGLKPTRKVRHTPVLSIRPSADMPGETSDGLLLLSQLLSPPLTGPQPSWRAPRPIQCTQSSVTQNNEWSRLPPEIIQEIVLYADTKTYSSLCRVSKSVRSVCLSQLRVGEYTILGPIPGHKLIFAARCPDDGMHTILSLGWDCIPFERGKWKAWELSPKQLAKFKKGDYVGDKLLIAELKFKDPYRGLD